MHRKDIETFKLKLKQVFENNTKSQDKSAMETNSTSTTGSAGLGSTENSMQGKTVWGRVADKAAADQAMIDKYTPNEKSVDVDQRLQDVGLDSMQSAKPGSTTRLGSVQGPNHLRAYGQEPATKLTPAGEAEIKRQADSLERNAERVRTRREVAARAANRPPAGPITKN